jgi:DnaK suppressor protein
MAGLNSVQLPDFDRLLTEQYRSLMHQVQDALEHSDNPDYRMVARCVTGLGEHTAFAILTDLGSPMLDRQMVELRHILHARRRIEQGTYGVCEVCGDALAVPWLHSHLTAARCAACERRSELSIRSHESNLS